MLSPRKLAATVATLGLVAGALALAGPAYAVDPFPPPPPGPTDAPGSFTQQPLAKGPDGVFPNYRIPALTALGNGVVLASYDGRPTGIDAPGPNSILQRRSTDGGRTWGPQTVIAAGKGDPVAEKYGYSDPSYLVDRQTGTVFNFHVYSKDTGFFDSAYGKSDTDRRVLSAAVASSTDGGLTWTSRLITDVVKPASFRATFASSGEGIQLRYGRYAGRLVQQYAASIRQPNGSVTTQAYSVYSDDHGATWQMGTPAGTGMDENKTVELSDGRLMMNSRDYDRSGFRKVAYSADGGQTWGPVTLDRQLIDPANNASIIRMYPDAPAGSADARKLLFSNSANKTSRANGTVRFSCDDGKTWPISRVFEPGPMSYSTLTPLGGDRFGLFYEGADSELRYAAFDRTWLGATCATVSGPELRLGAGESGLATVTVRNDDSTALAAGLLSLDTPAGWESDPVQVPAVAPGASATMQVAVRVNPAARAGLVTVGVRLSQRANPLNGTLDVQVSPGATSDIAGMEIYGDRNDAGRDLASKPYAVGEQVPYRFRIYNTGNVTASVAPTAGGFAPFLPPGSGNCRYLNLAAFADYLCSTPKHAVTTGEDADGFFVPQTSWELQSKLGTQTRQVTGAEVDTRLRRPAVDAGLSVRRVQKNPRANPNSNKFDRVGSVLEWTLTVRNTGNVRLTDVTAGRISVDELAAGAQRSVTWIQVLTADDLKAGRVTVPLTAKASNGTRTVGDDASTTLRLNPVPGQR